MGPTGQCECESEERSFHIEAHFPTHPRPAHASFFKKKYVVLLHNIADTLNTISQCNVSIALN